MPKRNTKTVTFLLIFLMLLSGCTPLGPGLTKYEEPRSIAGLDKGGHTKEQKQDDHDVMEPAESNEEFVRNRTDQNELEYIKSRTRNGIKDVDEKANYSKSEADLLKKLIDKAGKSFTTASDMEAQSNALYSALEDLAAQKGQSIEAFLKESEYAMTINDAHSLIDRYVNEFESVDKSLPQISEK